MKKRYPVLMILTSVIAGLIISACVDAPAIELPEAPEAFELKTAAGEITAEWSAVEGASSYEIWYGTTDNTAAATQAAEDITGLTFTITGLSSETLYYVWLLAVNEAGASAFSPAVQITTPDSTIPSKIYITEYSAGADSIDISWKNPDDADFDCAVLSCKNGASVVAVITISPEMETFSLKGLLNETNYSFTLEASDKSGNLSETAAITITTLASGADPSDWFIINTADDLNSVRDGMDKNYYLFCDIDLSTPPYNTGWTPLGASDNLFSGKFIGNGHSVKNLFISSGTANNQGLFYGIAAAGNVVDLSIEDADITGGAYTGALAGNNSGTVQNCSATGEIYGTARVGGLFGNCTVSLADCRAACRVSGDQYVGGLIGYSSGNISGCRTDGRVYAGNSDSYAGGLIGYCSTGIISGSFSTSTVNATGSNVGGLTGNITGSISDCYATGDITGEDYTGGLVGYIIGDLSDCHSEGNLTAGEYAGGLAGYSRGDISDCYAEGNITADNCTGGLAGHYNGNITNCHASGDILSDNSGGLLGYTEWNTSSISGCFATGNVSGISIGGLIFSTQPEVTITGCYATGDVTSGMVDAGGLVAANYGTIANCFATGNVSTEFGSGAGGLVSYNTGDISYSFSSGTVSGPTTSGGLTADNDGSITASFWDTETSGQSSSDGGSGLTTAEMQTESTFTDAGWDFTDVWSINGGYPFLTALGAP